MNSASKTYLMVLPVRYCRIGEQTVALEGPFAEHLRLLKEKVSPIFNQFVVGMIEMDGEEYEAKRPILTTIHEQEEGIFFKTIHSNKEKFSRIEQFLQLFSVSRLLKDLIKSADLLHTGLSSNIWFPIEFIATLWGILLRKKVVYVVDIDYRKSAQMNYQTGNWSLKSYLLCKYLYDQFRALQISLAVEKCSLVLLKGKKLCEDFGRGKPGVRNFLDAAHSDYHIIDPNALNQKLQRLRDPKQPFEVVYFGRLAAYKGVDLCLRAIARAHQTLGCDVIFHVIGGGEEADHLRNLARELGMEERVIFHGPMAFNLEFYKKLYSYHLLLAAPLSEDTPRSALDAMAAGIPILAFNTYYYTDLSSTGAVDTVQWLSVEELAEKIVYYDQNRHLLAEMVVRAINFAKQNTQEQWLDKRYEWTLTYADLQ